MSESRLLLVLLLIDWKSCGSYFKQLLSIVMQNQVDSNYFRHSGKNHYTLQLFNWDLEIHRLSLNKASHACSNAQGSQIILLFFGWDECPLIIPVLRQGVRGEQEHVACANKCMDFQTPACVYASACCLLSLRVSS